MAFNVTNLTDYTQAATEIFRENVLFSDNFSMYNYQEGISYKEYINSLSTDVQVQAGGCGIGDAGDTTLSEKELEVANYLVHLKYCYDDLRKKAIRADNFEEELTANVVESIKAKLNENFWMGSIAGGDLIDGIITQALADANVVTVTRPTPTVTTIITDVNALINGLPDKALTKYGELTIHTSPALFNMYRQALTLGNYYHLQDTELDKFSMWVFGYEGKVKIKMEPGFANNATARMLLTPDKNIFIGVDELQTVSELSIINDPITDFVHFKSKFKFGTTYLLSDEVVILEDV